MISEAGKGVMSDSATMAETSRASESTSKSIAGDEASGFSTRQHNDVTTGFRVEGSLGKDNNAKLPPIPAEESTTSADLIPPVSAMPPPSIHKRKLKQKPKGILKPTPPPTKAFSFRRDILQQLNTRLAQQGVNVQVPVPQGSSSLGSFSETAQGTAQVAGSIIGGMFKRMSGFASGSVFHDDGLVSEYSNVRPASRSVQNEAVDRGREQNKRASFQSSRGTVRAESTSFNWSNNLPVPSSSIRPLRKVRFTVSNMAVIYPISNTIAPGDEDATRQRVEKEHRLKMKSREPKDWTVGELEKLYRECCRTREEHPLKKMRSVFQEASQQTPPGLRTLDLSFITLDRQAIEPVADLLSVDFGLNKLVLENCGLTDDGLKSILHALLTSGSLPSLSLAANKKIKYQGWRYVGIFMRRAKALRYLDLSENSINKASLEHIAGAIAKQSPKKSTWGSTPASLERRKGEEVEEEEEMPLMLHSELLKEDRQETSSLTSLRLENCGLRNSSLELLAQSVRLSDLNHLSLRRNRIGQIGAVALAIMMKDYPDSYQSTIEHSTGLEELEQQQQQQQKVSAPTSQPQYAIRGMPAKRSLSPDLPNVPVVVSSPGGGVTRRSMPITPTDEMLDGLDDFTASDSASSTSNAKTKLTSGEQDQVIQLRQEGQRSEEEALSLFYAKRARRILSAMPRIGNLLTLDLKGNDIRGGVVYLSQALKKNRTLKVLNLSDNNIEMSGLVAIADALKYNATLETLDLSHNPCCGPGLEGITTLRNAFTLNLNLKRLFISDTDLSSEGAIALAEFLPEAKSLIHLDLTENLLIDIAGVMALAVSVRMNKSLRCLDLNIPPNAPDFARLSQEILNSCIRNTENAQRRAEKRGVKAPIAAPIYKSTLARAAKEKEERNRLMETNSQLEQAAKVSQPELNRKRVVVAAKECCSVLEDLLGRENDKLKELSKERGSKVESIVQNELAKDLLNQGNILRDKLHRALEVMGDGELLEEALQVNDEIEEVISKLKKLYSVPIIVGAEINSSSSNVDLLNAKTDSSRLQAPLPGSAASPSSPTFSIGSDDDEEEEEDVDIRRSKVDGSQLHGEREVELADAELQQAARELPSEMEEETIRGEEQHEVNDKARGQLNEEGEIFRRARSLQVDDDDDNDNDDGNKEGSITPSRVKETNSSALKDQQGTPIKTDEVSGEDLRRELLETSVPRSTSSRSIIEDTEQHQLIDTI